MTSGAHFLHSKLVKNGRYFTLRRSFSLRMESRTNKRFVSAASPGGMVPSLYPLVAIDDSYSPYESNFRGLKIGGPR